MCHSTHGQDENDFIRRGLYRTRVGTLKTFRQEEEEEEENYFERLYLILHFE